jgi:hypothetical protein
VFLGIAVAITLAGYGLVHYPSLRSGFSAWASVSVFLALLFVYAVSTLALSRGRTVEARVARRYGMAGGAVVGVSWFIIISPGAPRGLVIFPLAVAMLGPACIGARAARAARDARTGRRAALWSGIIGGLIVFIVWVTATYARDGRPYDPGLLRDFHRSGAHDLATYAVSDNLGGGLVLLLIIPAAALALGSFTARGAR